EVARYLVDLEVHARARAQAPESGRRAGVGNEVDAETRPLDLVDSEAHPVQGDRALGREVARERGRRLDEQAQGTRLRARLDHLRDAVDMSGQEVPAERLPGPLRWLEILRRARLVLL